jgi:tRNA threonylcarbamoyladenosine biosynthesis protein TsaB
MKILAIDTATERCSVALWRDGEVWQREQMASRAHAELILPMIDELLGQMGCRLSQLDAIAFGRGPGAFTGVRVAVSVAQGLAFGVGLPLVPVSDLEALAAAASRLHGSPRALVCMDARMREVYWAAYSVSSSGVTAYTSEAVSAPTLVTPPDEGGWFGVGEGFRNYLPELEHQLGGQLSGMAPDLLPDARDVAALAAQAYAQGNFVQADQALPVYLRDKVANPKPAL